MKFIICIGLIWLVAALATSFVWHRLRRHEHYMESLLPKEEKQKMSGRKKIYLSLCESGPVDVECGHCMGTGTAENDEGKEGECSACGGLGIFETEVAKRRGDDTDSATLMGMDKWPELTKAQLDRLPRKED